MELGLAILQRLFQSAERPTPATAAMPRTERATIIRSLEDIRRLPSIEHLLQGLQSPEWRQTFGE